MALQWAIMNNKNPNNDAHEFSDLTVPTFWGPYCLGLESFGTQCTYCFELQSNQIVLITHTEKHSHIFIYKTL